MRNEHVMIGAGGARLAPFANALRGVGLRVTVVYRAGLIAAALARAADAVVPLGKIDHRQFANAVISVRLAGVTRP